MQARTIGNKNLNWRSARTVRIPSSHRAQNLVSIKSLPAAFCESIRNSYWVDVGYKSEGMIPVNEWDDDDDEPEVGQEVDVLIEDVEDVQGTGELDDMILLSKRKAKKIREWERVMETVSEEDVVTGNVTRKIKGGLLVDIGVNVFLPASQVDIRRPADIGEYIGRAIQCKVLKIDEARRNIVVSRRALIEDERSEKKAQLLKELEIGQLRKGAVKNIADFGAFVDLGGLDGLLHITDMSWGRHWPPVGNGIDRPGN